MKLRRLLQIFVLSVFSTIILAQNTTTVNFENPIQLTANAGEDVVINWGDSVTLGGNPTAKGNSGVPIYEWTPGDGLSNPQLANPDASPKVTTAYTLKVTDLSGCFTTDEVVVTVKTLSGIEESVDRSKKSVAVFPNPNNGRFQFRPFFSQSHEKSTVSIVNMIGNTVYTEIVNENKEILQFDVSFLAKGLYCLKFCNGNYSGFVKFTIK